MSQDKISNFNVDKERRAIKVERSFNAPLGMVWSAWTEAEILDQWWGPKPWRAETKSMDFSEGGRWLYAMVGPQGERHWALQEFLEIVPQKNFTNKDLFADENGNANTEMPASTWRNSFEERNGVTVVTNDIRFETLEQLESLVNMGFKEGFATGLAQLEELLARRQGRGK